MKRKSPKASREFRWKPCSCIDTWISRNQFPSDFARLQLLPQRAYTRSGSRLFWLPGKRQFPFRVLNINHEFSPSLSAYIGGAIGNESFTIVSGADTLAVDSISMQMGIKWRISDRFSIGFNYVYEERKDQFNRNLLES